MSGAALLTHRDEIARLGITGPLADELALLAEAVQRLQDIRVQIEARRSEARETMPQWRPSLKLIQGGRGSGIDGTSPTDRRQ